MQSKTIGRTRKLVECAILIAIASVLSIIKIIEMPYGGSVTIASMLPIIIIAYKYGAGWGLSSGLIFAVIQQLMGLKNLSYGTSWQAVVAIILLDYIIAFTVAGLGGVFRKKIKNQNTALVMGIILVSLLRYICHVISGATVWAGLSIPTNAALIYSLGYNATYMLPEMIVLIVVGYYLSSMIDLSENGDFKPRNADEQKGLVSLPFNIAGGLAITAGLIYDTVAVFSQIQNAETGDFDVTLLANVSWIYVAIVSAVAAAVAAIFFIIGKKVKNSK